MEQINQLKTMRDEALTRLQANADYRLLISLDQLIVDLETVVQPPRNGFAIVDAKGSKNHSKLDDMMEQMGAELESATKDIGTTKTSANQTQLKTQ